MRSVTAANAAIGTVASRTRRLSACQTASNPPARRAARSACRRGSDACPADTALRGPSATRLLSARRGVARSSSRRCHRRSACGARRRRARLRRRGRGGGRGRPTRRRPSRRARSGTRARTSSGPAKLVRVERRRRGVVEHDEVGRRAGLERAEQRLAEDAGRRAARLGEPRERPVDAARRRRPRAGGSRRRATPRTCRSRCRPCRAPAGRRARDARAADRVVHVRARVVRERRVRSRATRSISRVVEMDAVREQRVLVERAGAREPLDDRTRPRQRRASTPSSAAWTCRPTPKSARPRRRRRASRRRA